MSIRVKWFFISLILLSLCVQQLRAQVWGSYTFSGFTDGWAWADNEWFPPVGPPCVIQPFPSPTLFTFHETIFSPQVWGHQIGCTPRSIRTTESAHICEPGPLESATVNAASHASYFVDGLETSRVTLSYKIGPNVQGNPEVRYDGYATAELDVTATLDVTNSPNGFPLQIYWSWKHVGAMGGSNFSELGNEDFCSTTAQLFINGVEQHNARFDFTNSFGRVELINQTGVINTFVGQSTTTVRIHLTGDVEVQNPPYYLPSGVPEMDEFQAYQAGYIRLSLNAPNPLTEPDSLSGYWTDFTVDVGGDAELSDTPYDSNEVFDPADIYVWHSPPLPAGGADGKGYEMDDSTVFGYDPNPNPPDLIPPATGVPVSSGFFNPFNYLDIDDYDFLDFYLGDFLYDPGNPPIGFFLSGCVYVPDDIYVSFDDDVDQNWSAAIGVPAHSSSPYQNDIYGQTARRDEIIRLQITYPGGGGQLVTQHPFQSEQELHQSLGPNPTAGDNTRDDDVDGMDIRDGQCNVLYFTVDHEAKLGYDPGAVYRHCDHCGILPVVDPQIHLGIPYGVDLDAIEFAWVDDLTGKKFALLFSVDDDDPNTPEDERGRDPFNNPLDPRMIYYSFLNGSFNTFLAQPLADDIDALALWKDPLSFATIMPVSDLVIRAVAGNLQFNFTAPQAGSYHLYGTTNANLIALPPSAGWTLTASMSAISSGQAMQHTMPIPGANYQRYAVIASRP